MKIKELIINSINENYTITKTTEFKELYNKVSKDINTITNKEHVNTNIVSYYLYVNALNESKFDKFYIYVQVDFFESKSDHFENTIEGFNDYLKEPLYMYGYSNDILSLINVKFGMEEMDGEDYINLSEIYG